MAEVNFKVAFFGGFFGKPLTVDRALKLRYSPIKCVYSQNSLFSKKWRKTVEIELPIG